MFLARGANSPCLDCVLALIWQSITRGVVFAACAFDGEEIALDGVGEPTAKGGFGRLDDVRGPGSFDLAAGQVLVGCLEDPLQGLPGRWDISGGGLRDGKVVGGLRIELQEEVGGSFAVAGSSDEAAAAREEIAARVAHFDGDIDLGEERAKAAGGPAKRQAAFAGVVEQQDGQAAAGQRGEGSHEIQHEPWGVFIGAKRSQGVENGKVDMIAFVQSGNGVHEFIYLVRRRQVTEGPTRKTNVAAEIEALVALGPKLKGFLGNDDGLAGGDGIAGECATLLSAGEE